MNKLVSQKTCASLSLLGLSETGKSQIFYNCLKLRTWILFKLSTTCLVQTNLGAMLSCRTRTLFSSNLPVMWCKRKWCLIGTRINASWLVSRRIICSLRSFFDRLVATNRQVISLLNEHRIHSLKVLYPGLTELTKISWTMKTQTFSTLQVFQSFSRKWGNLFLQSCLKETLRFLCEFRVNLLKGKLQSLERRNVTNFYNEVRILPLKRITWKQRSDALSSEKRLQHIKVFTPLVFNQLSWYAAVCSRPASVYNNNSLNTQTVTKQDFPKYRAENNPTYRIDSFKQDINEKLFARANYLVDKIWFCPRIKIPISQNLKLDGVETAVLQSNLPL